MNMQQDQGGGPMFINRYFSNKKYGDTNIKDIGKANRFIFIPNTFESFP